MWLQSRSTVDLADRLQLPRRSVRPLASNPPLLALFPNPTNPISLTMWPGRHLSLLDGHPSHPSSTGGASLDASQLRGLDAPQLLKALLSAAGSSGLAGPSHPVSLLGKCHS